MPLSKSLWGQFHNQDIYLFTMRKGLLQLCVTNLGCTMVSVKMHKGNNQSNNLILSYNSPQEYLNDPYYVGCTVGRYAGRIAHAAFTIDHKKYELSKNESGTGNHLHGGNIGFNKKIFSVINTSSSAFADTVEFRYVSPDGEEGYPGSVDLKVTYTLTETNEVIINYTATTDHPTHVNITNHSYFNLSGDKTSAIDHLLFIDAEKAIELDDAYIPTGQIIGVRGTVNDFTTAKKIADHADYFSPLNMCYLLANHNNKIKACLQDPKSGRKVTVKTTLPALVVYSGDFLGEPFKKNQGICLEAQFYPDSPNHQHFPSTLLKPGDMYRHECIYQFFN